MRTLFLASLLLLACDTAHATPPACACPPSYWPTDAGGPRVDAVTFTDGAGATTIAIHFTAPLAVANLGSGCSVVIYEPSCPACSWQPTTRFASDLDGPGTTLTLTVQRFYGGPLTGGTVRLVCVGTGLAPMTGTGLVPLGGANDGQPVSVAGRDFVYQVSR